MPFVKRRIMSLDDSRIERVRGCLAIIRTVVLE